MTFHNPILDTPPHLMPKLRSKAVRNACRQMPCTIRIASFIPGYGCADQSTVVGCHDDGPGKGMSSKTTDIGIVAGCLHCHDILDRRDSRWTYLADNYPAAVQERLRRAQIETLTYLLMLGVIVVPDGEMTK